MKCVINNEVVLSRAPEGPLAAHIGAFAQSRSAQGYAVDSIHRQVLLAADFSHWLHQKRVALRHVSSDQVPRYLHDRARRLRPCLGDAAALKHLIDCLRREGVIPAEKISAPRRTPAERCAHTYAQHLRDARALARATARRPPGLRLATPAAKAIGPAQPAQIDPARFLGRKPGLEVGHGPWIIVHAPEHY